MKLLVVTNRYPANRDDAASPFVPGFVAALEGAGATVRVVTPDYGVRPLEDGARVRRFRGTRDGRPVGQLRLLNPADALDLAGVLGRWRAALRDESERFAPDALLACWALPSGYLARAVARRRGIPLGVWCLGSDVLVWGRHPLGRGWVRATLAASEARWADGMQLAAAATRLAGRPCEFLPSWHALPEPAEPEASAPPGSPLVVSVGRLEARKGTRVFLAAAERLMARNGDVSFAILGWGPLEHEVRAWAAQPSRAPRVCFPGRRPPAEVAAWLGRADAVVLATSLDSIPLVFGEAVQAGAPLVVSNYGDLPELVRRYGLGDVFRTDDPVDLAAAIERVLAAGGRGPGHAGRARLMAEFSPGVAAGRVVARFEEILRRA